MIRDIPYQTKPYVRAHCFISPGRMTSLFASYYSAIDCANYDSYMAGRCFLAGFTVEEASEALQKLEAENRRDAAAIDKSEGAYFDDQRND